MISRPNEKCAVCGSTPKKRSLHRDHDHAWKKTKITIRKSAFADRYVASGVYNGEMIVALGIDRKNARIGINKLLLEASQRGVLCFNCNTGIRKFFDKPERLRAAADYLERFHGKTDKA
jgi:hypothetical protein